jgi:oxaloacetate decarboxylase (Na+ extruding) subunit gamma
MSGFVQDLMAQALELMLLGMGVVFGFLTTLVLATSLMSRLIRSWSPTAAEPPPKSLSPAVAEIEPRVARAIQLAVERYRQEH